MIKVKDLHKQFGFKHVLCGINFEVRDGETLAIIGSSGTGKSILLKNIVGLIKPTSGAVYIDGVNVTNCSAEELMNTHKKTGYVFQESALFDSMTIFENVAFGLKMLTKYNEEEISQRVSQCLKMVGLKNVERLKPSELSGGMKKRAALARAIAYQPKYIFYDEPTTGLDPIMSDAISDLIINLRENLKVTSIVVTHDMKSAYKIADRIIMLYKGEVVFEGTPQETKKTKNPVVRQFVEGSSHGPIQTERNFEMDGL
ncbi:ABC transporter ATP-binding protein [Endomicrobium proavitum]|uniref:Ribonucleotide ABC transporter ATP-binding protein n=1 Tax=Endomicrobium proavitum TaxID=1408281 RepID=A0A0G3WGB8_9BACT|nr:ABC transporter ATP-binding protein [Endomicrobium proavitum]AKL97398.1 ribonucleotide ABC transporter ATP-binding protein [Endomicrobium proavitum]